MSKQSEQQAFRKQLEKKQRRYIEIIEGHEKAIKEYSKKLAEVNKVLDCLGNRSKQKE